MTAAPPPVGSMLDAEKALDEHPPDVAIDDSPTYAESREPSPYDVHTSEKVADAKSSEKADDGTEKERKAGVGDYFVSVEQDRNCCMADVVMLE